MRAKAKITGVQELIDTFAKLREPATYERIAYKATIGPAKDLREAANANAAAAVNDPASSLAKAFAVKRLQDGTRLGYTVGVRAIHRPKKEQNNPWYWWLLEFGTVHVAPRHFFRDAINSWIARALPEVVKNGQAEVLKSGNAAANRITKARAKAAG